MLALDGEGVLYAAIDNSATRRVVIKEYVPVTICAARSRDGSVIPRQGREVLFKTTRMDFVDLYRSLVALGRNDGLVQVLDLIEENNTAYAVREPDEGTPLLTYLEQRAQPLTQSEALLLLRPVVYGVEAMHRMGLLHRGISPETVFITKTGSAKLSGYATLGLRTADSELKSQMFDGYAAPEQYAVAEFDGKYTDIYGLGALFYRVLTGKTPVPANLRRMNDTLPPAHTVDKEIPGFVSAAIARAMRLAPGERMPVCVRPSCGDHCAGKGRGRLQADAASNQISRAGCGGACAGGGGVHLGHRVRLRWWRSIFIVVVLLVLRHLRELRQF